MSITSGATRKAGPFTGNGATVAFPFTFKVFTAADVLVVQTDTLGVETTKTLTTDYTIALNANQDSNPGGTVTMNVAPPTGYLLTLGSQVTYTQGMVLTNGGGFFPTVLNDMADRVVILAQQLAEKLTRAFSLPFSAPANVSAQVPLPAAGSALKWNPTGTALVNSTYDPDALQAAAATSAAAALVSQNASAASASAASSSQSSAATSATNAGNSAASAAASAAAAAANVPVAIHAAANKATPVDADEVGIWDSVSGLLNKVTWANIKATLKTYFDTLYTSLATVVSTANLWTAQQRPKYGNSATANGGGSFTYDPPTHGQIALITCSTAGTLTFGAPTNIVEGAPYTFMLKAGDANARTPAWNAAFKWGGASSPITALSTTSGAIDMLNFIGGATNTLIYNGHKLDVR